MCWIAAIEKNDRTILMLGGVMLRSIKILPAFFTLLLLLLWPPIGLAQVVMNEVMYAPAANEPEWVELFNAGTDAVNLAGWQLHDATAARPPLPTFLLPPKTFVVVTSDTAALRQARPGRYRMLSVKLPTFNNTDDDVILRNGLDNVADSFHYQAAWGGGNGVSLERISPNNNPTLAESWGDCKAASGATPGLKNSLAALDLNLAVESVVVEGTTVAARIRNTGTLAAGGTATLFYLPGGGGKESLATLPFGLIPPGQASAVKLEWSRGITEAGEEGEVQIEVDGDEQTDDNQAKFIIRVPPLDTGLVINEVMNDPKVIGTTTTAEYVEVFNPLDRTVDMAGWRLYDATAKPMATLPSTPQPVPPGAYAVIASDTTIYQAFPQVDSAKVIVIGKQSFSLNVDADQVVLRNSRGVTIDSLHYWSDWWGPDVNGTQGVSLERVSPTGGANQRENWSGSVSLTGGTPGEVNSRSLSATAPDGLLSAIPETISPDGDNRDDFTLLAYQLPMAASRIVLQVYDRLGRPVVRLLNNIPSPAKSEVLWNGMGEDRLPVPQGMYVVRLEAYDASGGTVATAQATVVVARKM